MKISKVKRNNIKKTKLKSQGKLKTRRHRPKKQIPQKTPQKPIENEDKDNDYNEAEDLAGMVEEDDVNFLSEALQKKSYRFLNNAYKNDRIEEDGPQKKKRKHQLEHINVVEDRYEKNVFKPMNSENQKEMKMLLPIKTREGKVEKRIVENKDICDDMEETCIPAIDAEENDSEIEVEVVNNLKIQSDKPMTTIKLLALREETLENYKRKIGIYSSEVLETPEKKIKNLQYLLEFMSEKTPGISITVRKWSICSLCQVFIDLLPSYNILSNKQDGIKLKKETLYLQNYESALLNYYKQYLKKLEKICSSMRKKVYGKSLREDEYKLGKLAIQSMSELVSTHHYFNFSTNIANFLIPFLNNRNSEVRMVVADTISKIFKQDNRGELILMIVRRLNKFIKVHGHSVFPEVARVLLDLRLKDINLDKEKEDECKQKKLMSHKQRILALSKKERKKNKKLQEIEKELLETKAEENKQAKQKIYTDITSLVFTIYFRILKEAPTSKILTVCLEGLAKFAHCINIDFYQDLVNVLDKLLTEHNLGLTEQLYSIQTVFTMLSGQASLLNIDPMRFYTHLYKILSGMHHSKNEASIEIVIKILNQALIQRLRNISQNRLLAFVKRICNLSLKLGTRGTLALLCIVKKLIQFKPAIGVLLDAECGIRDGIYLPELDDPEYCNAKSSVLWEIAALQGHENLLVRMFAKNIAHEAPISGDHSLPSEIAKLCPEDFISDSNETVNKLINCRSKKLTGKNGTQNNQNPPCTLFNPQIKHLEVDKLINKYEKDSNIKTSVNFFKDLEKC